MEHKLPRPSYIKHRLTNVINISKIVTMHYFEFDKNFKFSGESHDFWEMVYVDSGNVHIGAGKNRHTLRQGELIFHKPNEFHTISSDTKTPSNVFVISFVTTSKNMVWFRERKLSLPANLRRYIKILIDEGRNNFDLPFNNPLLRDMKMKDEAPFGGQQIIRTTLEQFLIMLIRNFGEKSNSRSIFPDKESMDNHLVSSIVSLLGENIYGRITVDEICRKLNYSRTYISKLFNENCGCTIIEYYTRMKISEAKKLMREDCYSILEISAMLGFNNPHYFSRVFKSQVNMSPREYIHSVKE